MRVKFVELKRQISVTLFVCRAIHPLPIFDILHPPKFVVRYEVEIIDHD